MSKEKEEYTVDEPIHSIQSIGGSTIKNLTVKDEYVFSTHSNNTVRMWDPKTQKEVSNFTLEGKMGLVELRMDFLYIALDNTVLVWDAKNFKFLKNQMFQGHTDWVTRFAISGGVLYTASNDRTVRGWNIITGQCICVYEGHTDAVTCLDFQGPHLVTGSVDKSIKVWKAVGQNEIEKPQETRLPECSLSAHSKMIFNVKLIGYSVYTASTDGSIRVWEVRTGEEKHSYKIEDTVPNYRLDFKVMDGDDVFIWSASNHTIHTWNVKNGKFGHTFTGHRSEIKTIKKNEEFLYSGSEDRDIRQWSLKDGSCVRVMKNFAQVTAMALGTNNRLYAGGEDGSLKTWHQKELPEDSDHPFMKSRTSSFANLFKKVKSPEKKNATISPSSSSEDQSDYLPMAAKKSSGGLFSKNRAKGKSEVVERASLEKPSLLRSSSGSVEKVVKTEAKEEEDLVGWYMGPITRERAQELLMRQSYNCLVVRNSSVPGCYALTKWVASTKEFQHFLITSAGGRFTLQDSIDSDSYGSLWELVSKSIECKGCTLGFEESDDNIKR